MLDQVRVDPADLLDRGALARSLGSGSPAILDRRAQPRRLGDRSVVLPGGVAQDRDHLGGAGRAGGDERGIRRLQSLAADRLRISHTLGSQLVAVVVGVPTQLDVAHPPSSAHDGDERNPVSSVGAGPTSVRPAAAGGLALSAAVATLVR